MECAASAGKGLGKAQRFGKTCSGVVKNPGAREIPAATTRSKAVRAHSGLVKYGASPVKHSVMLEKCAKILMKQ